MQINTEKIPSKKISLSQVPQIPGVYIFFNNKELPLYVGKANNLRKRLESYFSKSLFIKTKQMVSESQNISFIRVNSEIEALLLEARIVRQLQPHYNTQLKDGKHPLYIKITKDYYPQVLTARKAEINKNDYVYGPFPSSSSVRMVLKLLRRVFPYSQHKVGKRGCLYSQIGLCSPCPSIIEGIDDAKEKQRRRNVYMNNIRLIKLFLSGRLKLVRENLDRKMRISAKNEDFEKAKQIRDKIKSIDYITQPVTPINYFLDNPNFIEDIRDQESKELEKILQPYYKFGNGISRLECFDVAHLSGTSPTASMVTFINGEPDKNLYRHFRIRQLKGRNDLASLSEVARRRLKYSTSWGLSDLVIVDGGKGQLGAFLKIFENVSPVVGLAKRYETLVVAVKKEEGVIFKEIRLPRGHAKNLMQRIRNEAHRFARRYHFKLLKRSLIPASK